MGLPNPSRETTFSDVNAVRENTIFPVQLITSRIGNLTGLIHTLLYVLQYFEELSLGLVSQAATLPLRAPSLLQIALYRLAP